jgi:hypothetical protein
MFLNRNPPGGIFYFLESRGIFRIVGKADANRGLGVSSTLGRWVITTTLAVQRVPTFFHRRCGRTRSLTREGKLVQIQHGEPICLPDKAEHDY